MQIKDSPREMVDFIRQIRLFAGLPDIVLNQLAQACTIRAYEEGEAVFYQQEPCEYVCFLKEGRIKIVWHDTNGREVILELIGPGEPFGGATIFLPTNPGDAIPLTRSAVVRLPAVQYQKFLQDYPDFSLRLIRALGMRLRSMMDMQILAGEKVERRIAHILLKLGRTVGRGHPEGTLITISVSRQELADMSGTTLETAIRTMSRFRSQGWLKTLRGGFILLLNEEKIAQMAQDT